MNGTLTLHEMEQLPGIIKLSADGAGVVYKASRKTNYSLSLYRKCYDGLWKCYHKEYLNVKAASKSIKKVVEKLRVAP